LLTVEFYNFAKGDKSAGFVWYFSREITLLVLTDFILCLNWLDLWLDLWSVFLEFKWLIHGSLILSCFYVMWFLSRKGHCVFVVVNRRCQKISVCGQVLYFFSWYVFILTAAAAKCFIVNMENCIYCDSFLFWSSPLIVKFINKNGFQNVMYLSKSGKKVIPRKH
jgi:hypothetical protein